MSGEMKINALVPYFGSCRMIAEEIGKELAGLEWVGIPFCGGLSELPHIDARTLVVSDMHREVINLCNVVKSRELRNRLLASLESNPFHPDALADAQAFCRQWRATNGGNGIGEPSVKLAEAYFVSQWMGRSGQAGTDREFAGGLSTRWNGNGGDSNTRYRSAVSSLDAWAAVMQRCNFHVQDAFAFLRSAVDSADLPGNGIYVDAPWPDDGDKYVHKFTAVEQKTLANALRYFEKARVVVRFNDHPLIRELYPTRIWTWRLMTSRTQGNNAKAEVLIMNGPSKVVTAAGGGLFA